MNQVLIAGVIIMSLSGMSQTKDCNLPSDHNYRCHVDEDGQNHCQVKQDERCEDNS